MRVGRGGEGKGKGVWVSVQSMGEMGKDFCPNFLQLFHEYINRRSCNGKIEELDVIGY